jgi:hypothetical protein
MHRAQPDCNPNLPIAHGEQTNMPLRAAPQTMRIEDEDEKDGEDDFLASRHTALF